MVRIVDLLQILSAGAGFLSLGVALVVAFFAVKNGVLQSANMAQNSAIGAMRSEIETLRERVEDAEKKNILLQQTMDTICSALEKKGFVITIQGEMVSIEDKRRGGRSTTARIRPVRLTKQDDKAL